MTTPPPPTPPATASRPIVTVADERLAQRCAQGRVILIDDDPDVLDALRALLDLEGYACETHAAAKAYLDVLQYNRPSFPGPCCVLCDVKMPDVDGLELQRQLAAYGDMPLLMMSGASGAAEAATAFRAGALNFLIKPIDADLLLAAIAEALSVSAERQRTRAEQTDVAARVARLTEREREILQGVLRGQTNPEIAAALGIALRTVKLHRQRAMEKVGAGGTAELVRLAAIGGL